MVRISGSGRVCLAILWIMIAAAMASSPISGAEDPFQSGQFRWRVSDPLLSVEMAQLPDSIDDPSERPGEHPWISVKDPSIVRYDDRWHLFCTLRKRKQGDGRIRIGYCSFDDFANIREAKWIVLSLTMGYHGAPQIFFHQPHQTWYLIYQATDQTRGLDYGPCFSTNPNLDEPQNWTLPEPIYQVKPGTKAGLDYWVICDDTQAHLFFTTNNGHMWRSETKIGDFPNRGWTDPVVALKDDIFEASHTYKLLGRDQYLTIIEAQADRRRYFKGYLADTLDGPWKPLASSLAHPLVSPANVINQSASWATSYSHGEFIRSSHDQRLEINPERLQLLFQGVNDHEYRENSYGVIPWRLGLLTAP